MKHNTLKTWAWLSGIVAVGAIALSACGTDSAYSFTYEAYDAATLGDPKALTAEVSFWETIGKANEEQWLAPLVADFNKTYPNIKIIYTSQGGYGDIKTKIDNAIAAGTTPTMAYCYPDHVADYLNSAHAVIPLDGFFTDATIGFTPEDGSHTADGKTLSGVDDYVSGYWAEGTAYPEKGTYSMPFLKSTEVLYYNKTVFDQNGWTVPETWDDMWTLCANIKSVFPKKTPLGYDSDSNLLISLMEQMNIPYTSATSPHYLFKNDQAKALVSSLYQHYKDGLLITKNAIPNKGYTSDLFGTQDVLMMVSSTGGASYAGTDQFDVEVAACPHVTGSTLKVIQQGPSVCVFSRATWAQRYAAFLFYRFVTDSLHGAYMATASTGYDPVRVSCYETDFYKNWLSEQTSSIYGKTAAVTRVLAANDNYFTSPAFVGSATARDEVGGILGNVFLGTKTIDEAFEYAYNQCVTGS